MREKVKAGESVRFGWTYHLLIRIMIRDWFFGWVGRFEKILLFVIYFYFKNYYPHVNQTLFTSIKRCCQVSQYVTQSYDISLS